MTRSLRLLALLFGATGLAACTGEIGAPVTPDGAPPPAADGGDDGGGDIGIGDGGGDGGGSCAPGQDPGRVTLHRLNRTEYNNTVRDLLGDTTRPADGFPNDDFGYGFDNVADVLSLSPLHLEKHELAVDAMVETAMYLDRTEPVDIRVEAEGAEASTGGDAGDHWNLWSNGTLSRTIELPQDGRYHVVVWAYGQQAGPDPVRMAVNLNNRAVATFDVTATSDARFEADVDAVAGTQTFSVEFLNDYYDEAAGADRNLLVDWFSIQGPLDRAAGAPSPVRARLVPCGDLSDASCARQVVETFATRAWRRPLATAEVDRLLAFVELAASEGDDAEVGVKLAMKAALLSPHFLYRVEVDPDPTSAEPQPLDAYELASRLSYFVWSSMPDEALFAAAASGALLEPAEIERQVRRMLADPKAAALTDNFAGQWLYVNKLDYVTPDYAKFPDFDEDLRAAMRAETQAFFRSFLEEDKSALELVTADYSYVNDRLAAHYGLPAPGSSEVRRVSLAGSGRKGILGQGTFLTVTSNPTRTSPVKRGKWVLGELLCSVPDDPPPGVEGFPEEVDATASVRERLIQHQQDPVCASCHELMDPIGFGLEGFDAVGAARESDEGFPIDATGTLPDGTDIDGAVELADAIGADPRLPACIAERMLIYATGRGVVEGDAKVPRPSDACHIASLTEAWAGKGHRLADLVVLVAQSEPFRYRRGEPEEP